MLRRLEDRIRELSAQVTTAEDASEVQAAITELRLVIHQHIQRVRARVFSQLDDRRRRPHKPSNGGS